MNGGIMSKIFYSPSNGGFFLESVHGQLIPADAVEISDEYYSLLLEGQSIGKAISIGDKGMPVLIDPPAPTTDDHRSAIAAERYNHETSGISLNGMQIDTGRDSQALITGTAVSAMLDPEYSVRWKTEGGFVDMDAQQIIGLATAVRAHVQSCFDREAELVAAVEDGSYNDSMLDEGWPNQ